MIQKLPLVDIDSVTNEEGYVTRSLASEPGLTKRTLPCILSFAFELIIRLL